MRPRRARVIELTHSLPGRVRLRLPWLRRQPDEVDPLADRLAALDGSLEVRIRPWTGSVLCTFDPERLDGSRILAEVQRHMRVRTVRRPDQAPTPAPKAAQAGEVRVRSAVNEAFHDMNRGVLHATDGRLDLGALTGLALLAAGALEVAVTRRLPAPPWFNLAWMAFRTFQVSGGDESEEDDGVEPVAALAAEEGFLPGSGSE
jgi:hypothetical protein